MSGNPRHSSVNPSKPNPKHTIDNKIPSRHHLDNIWSLELNKQATLQTTKNSPSVITQGGLSSIHPGKRRMATSSCGTTSNWPSRSSSMPRWTAECPCSFSFSSPPRPTRRSSALTCTRMSGSCYDISWHYEQCCNYTLPAHYLPITCPWPAHDSPTTCPLPAHYLPITCQLPAHYLPIA